jgi:hypothetical protein
MFLHPGHPLQAIDLALRQLEAGATQQQVSMLPSRKGSPTHQLCANLHGLRAEVFRLWLTSTQ